MATDAYNTGMRRYGLLYFGTADSAAATLVGTQPRTENPITLNIGRRDTLDRASRYWLPIDGDNSISSVQVTAGMYQVEIELLALALGFDSAGQMMEQDKDTTFNRVSVKIVGARLDGTAVTFRADNCLMTGDFTLTFHPEERAIIPVEFTVLSPTASETSTVDYQLYLGSGNDDVTLATGVLTRTAGAGYHIVNAESGTSDTLDSITDDGTALTDGESLRLQPASGDSITLTHLNDTLELWNDADWVMDSIYDYIDLEYDTTGTKWVETRRYDHSVSQA